MSSIEAVVIVASLVAVLARVFWRTLLNIMIITGVACVFIGVITLVTLAHSLTTTG